MPEEIALFIDFENIRYSMLNIQRREPDPQELIAVARRYGTVMVARAYADWSRQPEPFKGSLTAAMTSSARSAISSSRSRSKKWSSPSNQSVTIGVSQAAASKNRPDGQYPHRAISLRVMFSVRREDEYKAE